ncbi:MAG: hypothetical protein E7Z91_02135 [Cyanobacteria bacterium SIG30]|nr:hypothetical protein [Cyanobacteria bacterium SIG30]
MNNKQLYPFAIALIITRFIFLNANADIENKKFLTPKMLREIKIMENRHFKSRSNNGESESYRLERLEIELMGRSYENLPIQRRMERLKIASQKRMLQGVSLPVSLSKHYSPKRIRNDSIEVVSKNDDVGIIDGLMKVYAPDLFEAYRSMKDRQFEMFSD